MNVSIINIGDELLIGQVVNTNASTMSKMLVAAGMDVKETAVIADDRDAILSSLSRCLAKTDAVLITGGLGPTKDDITKKVLCEFFDSHLVENEEALNNVKRIFEARGYELTPINRQQAWVPECCTMVNNILGTAPCMWFEQNGKVVVSMPGVPFEMENLMRTEIVPRLQKHFHTGHIINKNLLVQGIGESFLSDLIESWELALPKTIRLAYLPQAGMVKLRLTARGEDRDLLHRVLGDRAEIVRIRVLIRDQRRQDLRDTGRRIGGIGVQTENDLAFLVQHAVGVVAPAAERTEREGEHFALGFSADIAVEDLCPRA